MWQLVRVSVLALACALLLAASTCGGKKSGAPPTLTPLSPTVVPAVTLDGGSAEPATDGFLMQRLREALERALAAREEKAAMAAPTGEDNLIVDLRCLASSFRGDRLRWHYRNLGDYNQDGRADIADLTPLVQNAGISSSDTVEVRSQTPPLDCETQATNITTLEGRGVDLRHDC